MNNSVVKDIKSGFKRVLVCITVDSPSSWSEDEFVDEAWERLAEMGIQQDVSDVFYSDVKRTDFGADVAITWKPD